MPEKNLVHPLLYCSLEISCKMTGSSLQQLIDCLKSLPFRELDSAVVDALWNGQLDDEGND